MVKDTYKIMKIHYYRLKSKLFPPPPPVIEDVQSVDSAATNF